MYICKMEKQKTRERYFERQYSLCHCGSNLFGLFAELNTYRAQLKRIDEATAEQLCKKHNIVHDLCCRKCLSVEIMAINHEIDNQ